MVPAVSAVPVLTFVSATDQPEPDHVSRILRDVIAANRATGIELEVLDVDADARRVRALGVIQIPALVLHVEGVERGRLAGQRSHRSVLHMVLPEIYSDDDEAVAALRRQLDSPGERFPRRVLKRHERVGKAARRELLGNVALFSTMRGRQLGELAEMMDELVVDAGGVVIRQGEPGTACYVVATGSLTVDRGKRRLAKIGPGEFVGEMALLDGGERTATVTAAERCVLLALDRDTFTAMLQHTPSLAISMLEALSSRLRRADARISD